MEELIISKDELVDMFENETIKDSDIGWLYEDRYIIKLLLSMKKIQNTSMMLLTLNIIN